jgi:hypothetical protein
MEKFKNIFKAGATAEPEETEEAGIVDEVSNHFHLILYLFY